MTVHINFPPEEEPMPEDDFQHFCKTLDRARRWDHNNNQVTVHIFNRNKEGWLEHAIDVRNSEGNRIICIGAIQRQPKAESEFHS